MVAAWAAVTLGATSAAAHETWLMPASFSAAAGESIRLDLTSGMGFPAPEHAIGKERVLRAASRLGGSTAPIVRLEPGDKALALTTSHPKDGVASIWVDLKPREIDLSDAEAAEYLDEIGAPDEIRKAWAGLRGRVPWKETYSKHAKTLVAVGAPGDDRSWADPVGSGFEIVPSDDPAPARAGRDFGIRLLSGGAPLASAAVGLMMEGSDERIFRTTDAEGRATFEIPRGGRALFFAVDLHYVGEERRWRSEFATLTLRFPPSSGIGAAAGVPASFPCGPDIEGSARLTAPIVVLGETHGTREIPEAFARLVCGAAARHPKETILVGIEILSSARPAIESFMESDGGAAPEAALLDHEFWRREFQDGRSSVAMLGLLDTLRRFRASGLGIVVVPLDPPKFDSPNERDARMAAALGEAIDALRPAQAWVLVGDVHSRVLKGYPWDAAADYLPFAARLRAGRDLMGLDVTSPGGQAWLCTSPSAADCGPHATRSREVHGPTPRIVLDPASMAKSGYDGTLYLGETSAALPARAAGPGASRSSDESLLRALHAKVLRAHRESRIDLVLEDESPDYVVASRGEITRPTLDERRARMGPFFERTAFEVYEDLTEPVVDVSADGTMAWLIAQIHARGLQTTDGGEKEPVEYVSAWIELYRKQGGRWLRAGNVSNFRP